MLKELSINDLLTEALEQILGYVKFMKDLVTKTGLSILKVMISCSIVALLLLDQ